MFTFLLPFERMIIMDDNEINDLTESSISQNTYVMIWVIASLASLAIFVKFF